MSERFDGLQKQNLAGIAVLVTSISAILFYCWCFFLSDTDSVFLGMQLRWWIVAVPVLTAVVGILLIVAWVGYVLATATHQQPIAILEEDKANSPANNGGEHQPQSNEQ